MDTEIYGLSWFLRTWTNPVLQNSSSKFLKFALFLDCEPSLYFAISGSGMADFSVWPSGVMQVGELGLNAHFSLIY